MSAGTMAILGAFVFSAEAQLQMQMSSDRCQVPVIES